MPSAKWTALRHDHGLSLEEAIHRFSQIPEERWRQPRAEGKWSPAEVAEHLILAYEAMLQELRGGPAMVMKTKWWFRLFLNLAYKPRILRNGTFPAGVRAPREARPKGAVQDQAEAVTLLRERGKTLDDELDAAHQAGRGHLTHPYFGRLSPAEILRFCTVHTRHHLVQLS